MLQREPSVELRSVHTLDKTRPVLLKMPINQQTVSLYQPNHKSAFNAVS